MRTLDELHDDAAHVILCVGDMIYDIRTKSKGFLKSRERRIDIIEDDIYIWTVFWFSQEEDNPFNNLNFIEEEGLKMAIAIGTVELYSIKQGG
jgi:hypothetical protein